MSNTISYYKQSQPQRAATTNTDLQATQENTSEASAGTIKVSVVSALGLIPVTGATVTISYTGDPNAPIETLTTDESGQTPTVELPAPPVELSLDSSATEQPYSEYNIQVTAEGYEPILVSGSEILPNQLSLQPIRMNPLDTTEDAERIVIIPAHTLFGEYPPKIPEDEIKPMPDTGEIVLSRVVIPEYVIVHDGVPGDSTAPNYWVRYKDYIKNVASCEIYSTWPESAIYANILAIQSFTLNRVYTEWYRNQGYNFTITSSTAYDQKWIYGRNIYENIDYLVDTIFANFLSRPGVRQPIFTSYCDGNRVTCDGLSQWGSKYLAEEGYSAIEIIRYYYGNDMYINSADIVSGVPSSWPGYDLTIGSSGDKVRQLQNQLNRIARNYPAIPTIIPDGIYGPATAEAIRVFQRVFNLPQTGVTDYPTWYEVSDIYVGVTRIAEPE
ncbi:MAG: peptidoglycan-binding protein [Lachnospiraceae bacterium]|nr:peptidoglycan-binding protein [Lachnospiraceae bacterium]